ncbi:MAG TPA: alpha/beta hydrolase [Terriglobales bacterium]
MRLVKVAVLGWAMMLGAWAQAQNAVNAWHVAAPPVVAQELKFSSGDAHLVGTVYMPAKGDHLPAVVVFHSASAGTRDAGLYKHLTESLPAMGFAVLIYDRRGEGQSSGSAHNNSYETLTDDGIAGARAMAAQIPRIDPKKIGYWGLSQGGWLSVLAGGRDKNAAFVISVSAPLTSPEEQMRFAMTNLMALRGFSQSDIRQMLDTRTAWTSYLRGSGSRSAALAAFQNAETKPWFPLVYLPKGSELTDDPTHYAWTHEMDDDPATALEKVHAPTLVVYGDSDPWIPVERSVEKLKMIQPQKRNIEYVVIDNANHEMMFPLRETMEVDARTVLSDQPQAPQYFMLMASWLARQTAK